MRCDVCYHTSNCAMRSSFDFERIKYMYQCMYHSFCPSSHQHMKNMRTGLCIQDAQCRRSPANVDWFMRMIIVNFFSIIY